MKSVTTGLSRMQGKGNIRNRDDKTLLAENRGRIFEIVIAKKLSLWELTGKIGLIL